jgi:hypothetical protein
LALIPRPTEPSATVTQNNGRTRLLAVSLRREEEFEIVKGREEGFNSGLNFDQGKIRRRYNPRGILDQDRAMLPIRYYCNNPRARKYPSTSFSNGTRLLVNR